MTDIEEWRPIADLDDNYEVSNFGGVRSLDRIQTFVGRGGRPTTRFLEGKILKGRAGKTGYLRVNIRNVDYYIHRLVAAAFIGPAPAGMDVCHYDGNKSNNRVENLRYATRLENMADQRRHGTHGNTIKEFCPRGHVLEMPNLVASNLREGRRYCLACRRAISCLKERGGEFTERDMQVVSNEKYLVIMLESHLEAS